MPDGRTELKLIDPDVTKPYEFAIAKSSEDAKLITIEPQPWEPTDPKSTWRVPVHPWDMGIAHNRIDYDINFNGQLIHRPSRTYAKSNADLSWPGMMVPPPLLTNLNFSSQAVSSFAMTAANLSYKAAPGANYVGVTRASYAAAPGANYGGSGPYYVAATGGTSFYLVVRNFQNKVYIAGSQYLYNIDPSYTVTLVKDFGNGKTIYDIEVFNNELVIAMGETEKIWKMTAAEAFTQATDATYAIALGTVGEYLWRAESTNKISSAITAPLTLTSWVPASPSQYPAGDSTYSITDIIEYSGFPAVLKPNGVFFPDGSTVFHNQTPQLATYPHQDNCKGAFVAWGYLWIPSVTGLLRVTQGESIPFGPELSGRPDYRFWVRGGVEWAGDIYLLCTDEAGTSETAVFKMQAKERTSVVFHELVRSGATTKGYFITVSAIFTNPSCIFGFADYAKYFKFGRGGGVHIDDSNYAWATSWEFESGDFIPAADLAIVSTLEGVEIVSKVNSTDSITLAYDWDKTGTYTSLLTTAEGGGTAPITGTSSTRAFYDTHRHPAINTEGQMLAIKVSGTNASGTGPDQRPEVREIWAYGYSHPALIDNFTIGILADKGARVRGTKQGYTPGEIFNLFTTWMNNGKQLEMQLADYREDITVRVHVSGVHMENISTRASGGVKEERSDIVTVLLRRSDMANAY